MFELRRATAALFVAVFFLSISISAQAETVTAADGSTIEKFGNWRGKCASPDGTNNICTLSFEIRSEQSQSVALFFAIGRNPNNEYYAITIVPLGTHLPNGVKFGVDGTELAAIPLQVCIPIGCQSISPVAGDSLQRLKAGNNMTVDFIDIRNGPVSLDVSLSGMTAGINWLDQQAPS
ncbi:MAG TPA: hypothetical protein DD437_01135 [Rhodobiaceae bacterium]|nr:hypothetical protein [Rhodobiaceae bacterium]